MEEALRAQHGSRMLRARAFRLRHVSIQLDEAEIIHLTARYACRLRQMM